MKRYLAMASQTLTDAALVDTIAARVAAGACQVHVVVPASPLPGKIWPDGDTVTSRSQGPHRRRHEIRWLRWAVEDPETQGLVALNNGRRR
jgi:hypothetical protein